MYYMRKQNYNYFTQHALSGEPVVSGNVVIRSQFFFTLTFYYNTLDVIVYVFRFLLIHTASCFQS